MDTENIVKDETTLRFAAGTEILEIEFHRFENGRHVIYCVYLEHEERHLSIWKALMGLTSEHSIREYEATFGPIDDSVHTLHVDRNVADFICLVYGFQKITPKR